jgi:hypothetical protein
MVKSIETYFTFSYGSKLANLEFDSKYEVIDYVNRFWSELTALPKGGADRTLVYIVEYFYDVEEERKVIGKQRYHPYEDMGGAFLSHKTGTR